MEHGMIFYIRLVYHLLPWRECMSGPEAEMCGCFIHNSILPLKTMPGTSMSFNSCLLNECSV